MTATETPRRLSGMFVTVGTGGRLITGGGPGGIVESLLELVELDAAGGSRWRVVWLCPGSLPLFGLDAGRREPLPLTGRLRARCASWEPGSPFAGINDPQELFHSLWNLEEALGGLGWMSSGAVTSDVLLRRIHQPPHGRPIRPTAMPAVGLPDAKGTGAIGGELPLNWHRSWAPTDRGAWVHHYDLNGAYLAAASKLRLPQGDPVRFTPGAGPRPTAAGIPGPGAPHRMYPGYWHVERPGWNIGILPDPVGQRRATRTPRPLWVTSPTLRYLDEIAEPYTVTDGWYWLSYSEPLTRWYEILRDARKTLTGPELRAVKQIYREGIGRLASLHEATRPVEGTAVGGPKRRGQPDDPLEQPAWAHHVIAESRSRIHRRLMALAAPILAVETDGIWIPADDPDPHAAARHLRLPLGDGLGEWKHLGTMRAQDAQEALAAPAGRVLSELRKKGPPMPDQPITDTDA